MEPNQLCLMLRLYLYCFTQFCQKKTKVDHEPGKSFSLVFLIVSVKKHKEESIFIEKRRGGPESPVSVQYHTAFLIPSQTAKDESSKILMGIVIIKLF